MRSPMFDISKQKCAPCDGGMAPLDPQRFEALLGECPAWARSPDGTAIERNFAFRNFYETMAFVNAVAWVAHHENHHPNLQVTFNQCTVTYFTHTISGLTENDFICAAKIDRLL